MKTLIRQIPNCITCLNILAGCMAIISASHASEPFLSLTGTEWAYIFIGIAAIADFCDGMAARLLHAYSELGKQLDSLCDCVSFCVAPAMILFFTLSSASEASWLSWCALLIPIAGAVRLGRFNIDTRQTSSFIGLPVPANAIFWIGYTALIAEDVAWLAAPSVFLPVLLLECWLMNSNLPIFSLKVKSLGFKGNEARWLLVVAAIVFVVCLGVGGLLWLIVFYVLLSLLPFSRR